MNKWPKRQTGPTANDRLISLKLVSTSLLAVNYYPKMCCISLTWNHTNGVSDRIMSYFQLETHTIQSAEDQH